VTRPEIGLHKNVNLWNLEYMKTKWATFLLKGDSQTFIPYKS